MWIRYHLINFLFLSFHFWASFVKFQWKYSNTLKLKPNRFIVRNKRQVTESFADALPCSEIGFDGFSSGATINEDLMGKDSGLKP